MSKTEIILSTDYRGLGLTYFIYWMIANAGIMSLSFDPVQTLADDRHLRWEQHMIGPLALWLSSEEKVHHFHGPIGFGEEVSIGDTLKAAAANLLIQPLSLFLKNASSETNRQGHPVGVLVHGLVAKSLRSEDFYRLVNWHIAGGYVLVENSPSRLGIQDMLKLLRRLETPGSRGALTLMLDPVHMAVEAAGTKLFNEHANEQLFIEEIQRLVSMMSHFLADHKNITIGLHLPVGLDPLDSLQHSDLREIPSWFEPWVELIKKMIEEERLACVVIEQQPSGLSRKLFPTGEEYRQAGDNAKVGLQFIQTKLGIEVESALPTGPKL